MKVYVEIHGEGSEIKPYEPISGGVNRWLALILSLALNGNIPVQRNFFYIKINAGHNTNALCKLEVMPENFNRWRNLDFIDLTEKLEKGKPDWFMFVGRIIKLTRIK